MRRCLLLLELPSQCRVLVQSALSGGGWVGKGTGGVHTSGNQVDNSPRLTWQHCSTSLALPGWVGGFQFSSGTLFFLATAIVWCQVGGQRFGGRIQVGSKWTGSTGRPN